MHRSSKEQIASARAHWLGELSAAIEDAQQLAWALGAGNSEAMELYGRLEQARVEVESIRRSGWASRREELSPEWMKLVSDKSELLNMARS